MANHQNLTANANPHNFDSVPSLRLRARLFAPYYQDDSSEVQRPVKTGLCALDGLVCN